MREATLTFTLQRLLRKLQAEFGVHVDWLPRV